ncbi:major facilitator superfamily domain-containing protein [Pseudomassariella vexata]|uniref:Major facilitator superfamily domain-containing protein n=1 Tax=Pseudomassariella vexata TaxID=1141098 RepID=A0A1Y2E6G2_9PEZI|nr:major facilitator superfamily domain-containing protein [Pseudomassariella vexata]ORY67112.1 major facilitator superfamily domain-containing protein [Pseudomassariella vexata]
MADEANGDKRATDSHTIVNTSASQHARDAAAEFLHKNPQSRIIINPADDKRLLQRIDLVILPIMLTVYFLQALDKATLAYASVFCLIDHTGSTVYLAQLLMQLPMAWLLVRLPIAKFNDFGRLLATRLFFGAFEASVAPRFIAIMQTCLITYGLGHTVSHLHSYQIILIFFGVITVTLSFVMLTFTPDSLVEANSLKDNDKLIAVERLRMNQMGVVSIPFGGISTIEPLVVKTCGFDNFQTILFNIPFGAVHLVTTVGEVFLAQKLKKIGSFIALLCIPSIVSCAVLVVLPHEASHRVPFYSAPLIYSRSAQNTPGDTKPKCINAVLFIGHSTGNVVGPLLYRQKEAPSYSPGLKSNLALYVVIIVLVVVTTLFTITSDADGLPEGERAFENLLDLQSGEFVFVV